MRGVAFGLGVSQMEREKEMEAPDLVRRSFPTKGQNRLALLEKNW